LDSFTSIRCAVVLLAVLSSWSPPVSAAAASGRPERETAQHAGLGRRYVEMGRDHDAISEYRKAYELRADPAFLFQIAGCYRRLGNAERALFFYERYLAAAPTDDPDIGKAEQAITALDPGRARPASPSLAPAPALMPSFEHDLIVVPLPPATPPPARRPLWRRWWLWTAVGAAVALGTAFALHRNGDDEKGVPATALGNMRFR
jgi:tetratricopeptide (TPR) repeat protein